MEKLKVYLAGDMFTDWRNEFMNYCRNKTLFHDNESWSDNIKWLLPIRSKYSKFFMPRDFHLLNIADVMIARVDDFRIGTYIEMGIFYEKRKPILTLNKFNVKQDDDKFAPIVSCSTAVFEHTGELVNALSFLVLP